MNYGTCKCEICDKEFKDFAAIFNHVKKYHRVLSTTSKPTATEYKAVIKVAAIGLFAIGLIGFIIFSVRQLL